MQLWTALILGFAGSLHCGLMCGPLIAALPRVGQSRASFALGRLIYNGGRIAVYCVLGLAFGALGETLSLVGLQRWLSLLAGAAILLGLLASRIWRMQGTIWRGTQWLKKAFAKLLQRPSYGGSFALGAINGLLPCGLVYVALAGATASGHIWQGGVYMIVFGLGTLPMMLGIGFATPALRSVMGTGRRLIPISVAIVGLLLLLRGLSLGIPYLSPELSNGRAHCAACRN